MTVFLTLQVGLYSWRAGLNALQRNSILNMIAGIYNNRAGADECLENHAKTQLDCVIIFFW